MAYIVEVWVTGAVVKGHSVTSGGQDEIVMTVVEMISEVTLEVVTGTEIASAVEVAGWREIVDVTVIGFVEKGQSLISGPQDEIVMSIVV